MSMSEYSTLQNVADTSGWRGLYYYCIWVITSYIYTVHPQGSPVWIGIYTAKTPQSSPCLVHGARDRFKLGSWNFEYIYTVPVSLHISVLTVGCTSRELFEILFVRSAVYASLPRPPQLLHPCLRPPWQVHHLKHHHHDHHLPILGLGKRLMYIPTYLCNQANVLAGYS